VKSGGYMTDSALAVPAEIPNDRRWLRLARAAAFCSLSLFLIAVIVMAFLEARENGARNLVFVLLTALLWLPYLWMLLQMNAKIAKSRKKGLALAIAYGVWALIIAAPSAVASYGLALKGGFAIFALLQVSLIVSGIKTYSAMEKEAGDKRILVNRVFAVSACLGILCLAAIYIPCMVSSKVAANEASSVSAMRTIRTAQSSYAERYPRKGFAAALWELGPPPGADLIDQQLASGTRFGYSFNMIAAPADATGRVAQYTVLARPLTFGQTGRRSLFADTSGVIRSTVEDRAPTPQDRPLN
jgi:hypothetical protein